MKVWILSALGILVLISLPASADHRSYRARHYYPSYVSVGYGYPYYRGHGHYYPSSLFGIGINLGPRFRGRRAERERDSNRERGAVSTQKLYIYPAAGQSEAQTAEDRYQCHVWAADNSGFDPTLGAGSAADATNYGRAFTACMQGRDYVVK